MLPFHYADSCQLAGQLRTQSLLAGSKIRRCAWAVKRPVHAGLRLTLVRAIMYAWMMRSGDAEAPQDSTPGLSGPVPSPREALDTVTAAETHSEGVGSQSVSGTPVLLVAEGAERSSLATPVREVDRRNGNAARARKQAARQPEMVEDAEGNVHHVKAVSLAIPEEKRCRSLTVHGERCKAGKMRGMEVCVFHSHRALSDDALATIAADPDEVTPRLTPRKALKAVVALRAGELAEAAVGGALAAEGANRTRAVLALVDAVDPLVTEEGSITLSREGAATATWSQMRQIFNPTG